jgi:hypothetical protein
MLGPMTALTGLLYLFRPLIFIGAFIALTLAALSNAGLIGKLFYNKAADAVGASSYVLPPRSVDERLASLRQSRIAVAATPDDPSRVLSGDLRVNYVVTGSLRNVSKWTFRTAYIACRYPAGTSGVLVEVQERIDIDLKPDTKIDFRADLTSKRLEKGIDRPEAVTCFVKDAFPISG